MSSHIAHAAASGERIPLWPSGLLKALFSMEGTAYAVHGFAIFLDHFPRIQLGVHQDRVHRSLSEKGFSPERSTLVQDSLELLVESTARGTI
jgi:hypothetical protein